MSNLTEVNKAEAWGKPSANVSPASGEGASPNSPPKKFPIHTANMIVSFDFTTKEADQKSIEKILDSQLAQAIFRPNASNSSKSIIHESIDAEVSPVSLEKGLIVSATVRNVHSTVPYPVSVHISGQGDDTNLFDFSGKQAALVIQPHERAQRGTSQVLFDKSNILDDQVFVEYAGLDYDSLWTSIQRFDGEDRWAYVPIDHKALRLIQLNPTQFGAYPTASDVREGRFYKMDAEQIGKAITELYMGVIRKFKFNDLSKFKVSLTRLDGKNLSDLSGTEWAHLDEASKQMNSNKTLFASFELCIKWTTPSDEKAPKAQAIAMSPSPPTKFSSQPAPRVVPGYNAYPGATRVAIPVAK